MRWLAALLVCTATASAQPGASQPQPPPPPPPNYNVPPPYQYQPGYGYPAQLTPEEHELLLDGEISDGAHIGGGIASIFIGFGAGQAIQGRWSDTGWIFTLGESASIALLIAGAIRIADDDIGDNDNDDESTGGTMLVGGLIGYFGFRIWDIVDAFGGPPEHNRKVRALKYRLGIPVRVGWKPYMNSTRDATTAGLTLRF
jgi:hypothetical protein